MGDLSREYLENFHAQIKQQWPGWAYAVAHQRSKTAAGGKMKREAQEDQTWLEKLALTEIRPGKLRDVDDTELRSVWRRLHQWYSRGRRRKRSVEDVVNAALWVSDELKRRGLGHGETELTRAVDKLRALRKDRSESVYGRAGDLPEALRQRLKDQPEEILIVRDFAVLGGSAAVAERPNDLDVIIRADYDEARDRFMLDGTMLGVALRRFLAPDKHNQSMQLIHSAQGSFTDMVPLYDLVARRREPHVVLVEPEPPEYAEQGRVVKQARAATAEIRAQAEKARKADEITLGEFFYQPKPTRPAFEEELQTVDRLVSLYKERAEKWLPALVQKKYDGVNHQAHKDGDKVTIFSEDGDDNTERLPKIVAAIKALRPKRLVLPFELERWRDGQHLPRESVAGYLAERAEPDDSDLVANIYDLLWDDEGDLHERPYRERLNRLTKIGIKQSTMGVTKPGLNRAPAVSAKTPEEIRKMAERIRKLPGSEGIVAKRLDSPYRLEATTKDDWVKFHNATTIRGVVTDSKRTKGGAWVYSYGVLPGDVDPIETVDVEGREISPVGDTFSTARKFSPGDGVLVEAETVNHIETPEGVRLTAWVPRVIGQWDGKIDTIPSAARRAGGNLVLQRKKETEDGEVEFLSKAVAPGKIQAPTRGPAGAPIAFVGASLGAMEAARREPFTGPAGETLNEIYLEPLGVKRSNILLTNAVPQHLTRPDGSTREPTIEEIKQWREWLEGELDAKRPKIVIALGRTAESALGDRADFTLPHPSAVRRFGDSGEVGRKMKQIKAKLRAPRAGVSKQLPKPLLKPREEGGTRSTRAFSNWEKNWHTMLPTSGKGRFTYQHHWQGLSEDETGLSDEKLMDTTHSIHGDIRLEGDDDLWGAAVFLGRAADNKGRELNDKLVGWKKDDNIELAMKLPQPKEWLKVGVKKPTVSEPGEFGAAGQKYSKFFGLDTGTYELGVARQHMVEVFLDGKHLKGRYLFTFAPVAGRRRWLIEKPEDQTPMAERRDLADLISELRRKRQRYLFWGKPGEKPKKIDVRTGRVEKREPVPIIKAEPLKHIVYGIVLDPYGRNGPEEDAHRDWNPPSAIEETAHDFEQGQKVIDFQHRRKADAVVVETHVEDYPTRADYLKAMRNEPHRVWRRKFGDDVIHSGAWRLGVKLGPKEWAAFERGEINAFSPMGLGIRTPIDRSEMPEVTFVDLVEKPAA